MKDLIDHCLDVALLDLRELEDDVRRNDDEEADEEFDDDAALGGVAPHHELHGVVLDVLYVLAAEEAEVLFVVLDTVVVIEKQKVIRRRLEDHIIGRIRTSPYLLDHVLRILSFQKANNLINRDEIERVAIVHVLLQEQVAHL